MAPARTRGKPDPLAASLTRVEDYFLGRFPAMGSPCEALLDTDDRAEAAALLHAAQTEAKRIEEKFSRYRPGNIVDRINRAGGRPVAVDDETALLLNYATTCYHASDGMFDITSGVLRRVWRFDGGSLTPDEEALRAALALVGWQRAVWQEAELTLPAGMEIDLGGVGKEYAVDHAAALLSLRSSCPFLLNFGGDLFARCPRRSGRPWGVGVEDPEHAGGAALYRIDLPRGGLATSGDARRFTVVNGRRLGHILNPKTGWPVEGAPHSVTVLGRTCLEAGTLSTLAYLQGAGAREFLEEQGVGFWIL
jgi:FAD:protein FMN transferase